MLRPFRKFMEVVNERGVKGAAIQLYTVGESKPGILKGTDLFGNKYYENLSFPFGQHRWIEYADIHNYDSSMIQPEWHGWMHHVCDETPIDGSSIDPALPLNGEAHAIYKNHIGLTNIEPLEQINQTTLRQRGYKVGSLKIGPEDTDKYYKQPGHPLSPLVNKGGRFTNRKDLHGQIMQNELNAQ